MVHEKMHRKDTGIWNGGYFNLCVDIFRVLKPESFIFSWVLGSKTVWFLLGGNFLPEGLPKKIRLSMQLILSTRSEDWWPVFKMIPTIISFAKSSCLTQRNANGARMHTDAPTHPIFLQITTFEAYMFNLGFVFKWRWYTYFTVMIKHHQNISKITISTSILEKLGNHFGRPRNLKPSKSDIFPTSPNLGGS